MGSFVIMLEYCPLAINFEGTARFFFHLPCSYPVLTFRLGRFKIRQGMGDYFSASNFFSHASQEKAAFQTVHCRRCSYNMAMHACLY